MRRPGELGPRGAAAGTPGRSRCCSRGLNPGPATLRHHNAVIGTLRAAGFSVELTAHAFALIDSYVYGFALSEAALPIHGPESVAEVAEPMMAVLRPGRVPAPLRVHDRSTSCKPGYDFGAEFGFGLDLILDGLQRSSTPGAE